MKSVLFFKLFFATIIFISCQNNQGIEDCNWDKKIHYINSIEGHVNIWHTLNKFVPEVEKNTNQHNYSKDFFLQDFRQLELISKDFHELIIQQFEEAKSFKVKVDHVFEKVYIRDKIPSPIKKTIPIDSLMEIFEILEIDDLVFRDCDKLKAKNGFLIDFNYARMTGILNEKREVIILGINNFKFESPKFLNKLERLMKKMDCLFVSHVEEIILSPNQIHQYDGDF